MLSAVTNADGIILKPFVPELPRLLAILSAIPGLDPSTERGGWARAFWLYGATPLLSRAALGDGKDLQGRSTAEVFVLDPEAVIATLTPEARRDPNTPDRVAPDLSASRLTCSRPWTANGGHGKQECHVQCKEDKQSRAIVCRYKSVLRRPR